MVVGVGLAAADYNDYEWSFYNQNSSGNTDTKTKGNLSNVYVYPQLGLTLNYTVERGVGNPSSLIYQNCRYQSPASIPSGTKATLRNLAEVGYYIRVKYTNSTFNYGYTKGVWSPDSTQYYTVY